MELKNKSTTVNKFSKTGLIFELKDFDRANPNYQSVIGYVHDYKNRKALETYKNTFIVYYYGGDSNEIKDFVTETIISFYEKKNL